MSQLGNLRALGVIVGNLGELALVESQLDTALHYFFEAIRYSKDSKNGRVEAYFTRMIGEVYLRLGRHSHARRYLASGCEELKRLGDRIEYGKALCALGRLECVEGKLASAQTLLDAAIGLDRDVDQGMRTELTFACDELRDSIRRLESN